MTKEDIIVKPNPLLTQRSKKVRFIDEDIRRLAENMIAATLDWESTRPHEFGAALAAVQLGQLYRLIVVRNDFENKEDKSFAVFINPEVVKQEGEPTEDLEGCLSVRDIYGQVARYPKVKVKALNLDGKEVRITATGFLARVFQHEVDHTNGTLFTDHIKDVSKLYRLEHDGHFTKVHRL